MFEKVKLMSSEVYCHFCNSFFKRGGFLTHFRSCNVANDTPAQANYRAWRIDQFHKKSIWLKRQRSKKYYQKIKRLKAGSTSRDQLTDYFETEFSLSSYSQTGLTREDQSSHVGRF